MGGVHCYIKNSLGKLYCAFNTLSDVLTFFMPVIMPRVVPSRDEVYLCTAVDVSQSDGEFWVRGFEPRANMRNVHHMAVAGKQDLHDLKFKLKKSALRLVP